MFELPRFALIFAIFATFASASANDENPKIWAVLVAGSNGWGNYRHQADICHAYHVLTNHGVPRSNIITMLYDDVATDKNNPYPGKLYNQPGGPDVYAGVKKDYTKADVTAENFLNVLSGNKNAMQGIGSGRVIESGPNDNVFVYFTDHGAPGMVAFPDSALFAKQLNKALKDMHTANSYQKLVFYMEACESGSMFDVILPNNLNIYAITAANDHESSWGAYCQNNMHLPCMGDLFSVNWMQDSDKEYFFKEDLRTETLFEQFVIVRSKTNLSHVERFGDFAIADEPVANYQGHAVSKFNYETPVGGLSPWRVEDIPINTLKQQLKEAVLPEKIMELKMKITIINQKRQYLDSIMRELVESVVHDPVTRNVVLYKKDIKLTQYDCQQTVTEEFHRACFHLSQNPFALRRVYILKNLCEERIDTEILVRAVMDTCSNINRNGLGFIE